MATSVGPTGNQDIDGILEGWKWSGLNLSYSFPANTAIYDEYDKIVGFQAFNAAQQVKYASPCPPPLLSPSSAY